MSENRIRKTDTTQASGPASAGMWVTTSKSLKLNPDGTTRDVGPVIFTLTGVVAATSSGYFAVAPVALEVVDIRATWTTGSTSGTAKVVKGAAGTAVGSGTDMTATVTLAGTANTPVSAAPVATVAATRVAAGEQLGIVYAGTMTNLVGGVITVRFRQV